jgi:TM2 domain-containing membrane protein YozV
MIDPELLAKLDEIGAKADQAYNVAETVRKYLFWTGIITAALIILPMIGLAFAIPSFISSYTSTLNGLGL